MCAYLYAGALVDPLQQRLGALDRTEPEVVSAASGEAQPADLPGDSCGRRGSHLGIHFVLRSLNNSSTTKLNSLNYTRNPPSSSSECSTNQDLPRRPDLDPYFFHPSLSLKNCCTHNQDNQSRPHTVQAIARRGRTSLHLPPPSRSLPDPDLLRRVVYRTGTQTHTLYQHSREKNQGRAFNILNACLPTQLFNPSVTAQNRTSSRHFRCHGMLPGSDRPWDTLSPRGDHFFTVIYAIFTRAARRHEELLLLR